MMNNISDHNAIQNGDISDDNNQIEEFETSDHQDTPNSQRHFRIKNKIVKIFLPLVGIAIIVGICCGLIVGTYIFCVERLIKYSKLIFSYLRNDLRWLPLAFSIAILLGILIGFLTDKFSEIRGSGIPYIESVARGDLNIKWFISLPLMCVSSMVSIFSGYSFGAEGPSVYMGGCIGYGIGKILKLDKMHDMLMVAAGSSSGLSIAFNAPLSGLIFSIEEVYRKFSMQIIITSILTVSVSQIVDHLIFKNVHLDIGSLIHESFTIIPFIIAISTGIIGGLIGSLFNILIRNAGSVYEKIKPVKSWMYPIVPSILAVIFGVWWPDACFGDSDVMKRTLRDEMSLKEMGITFLIKFIFIIICFGSKATGGIFIPMLTIGALLGSLIGKFCIHIGINEDRYSYIALMATSAFFTGVVRAPLTAAILPVEYTQQYMGWLGPITSVAFSFAIAEMLHVKPLYEALMEKITNNGQERPDPYNFIYIVKANSIISGLEVREVILPRKTLIVQIIRDYVPMLPSENIVLREGDEVIIASETTNPMDIEEQLSLLFY
ncbi:H(+)/Cl(-) exchange transporter ClcA [Tritrichomonas foetus]|uniref:H(+)/Cl(-) exchange transporter ClcA n=1 Tax=Tritrichomonas foetus TaxID=1144522 RepID=A0A1J4KR06_9EUKA|nr:H(+)/Cl(-) exchange transporter ClcA [Tritrichomonas foetus]|eukprot:OHT12102.1 H(+)/Cl(-) exchange transporter ClcA [Tritrichomonas foetus]